MEKCIVCKKEVKELIEGYCKECYDDEMEGIRERKGI